MRGKAAFIVLDFISNHQFMLYEVGMHSFDNTSSEREGVGDAVAGRSSAKRGHGDRSSRLRAGGGPSVLSPAPRSPDPG